MKNNLIIPMLFSLTVLSSCHKKIERRPDITLYTTCDARRPVWCPLYYEGFRFVTFGPYSAFYEYYGWKNNRLYYNCNSESNIYPTSSFKDKIHQRIKDKGYAIVSCNRSYQDWKIVYE